MILSCLLLAALAGPLPNTPTTRPPTRPTPGTAQPAVAPAPRIVELAPRPAEATPPRAALSPAAARAARELVEVARGTRALEDWLAAWRAPGAPNAAAWEAALHPDSATRAVLARAEGIAWVADGPGYTRLVLATRPLLSLEFTRDEAPAVQRLAPTACLRCSEAERFVVDLLADVRARGRVGPRLLPGIELDVSRTLAERPELVADRWPALLATHLDDDARLADLLGGTVLTAVTPTRQGAVATLRLADGRTERWTVDATADGWVVRYDLLPATSPLRLDRERAKDLRRIEVRQALIVDSWAPSWRAVAGGTGRVVGEQIAAGRFLGADAGIGLALIDLDRARTALMVVDADRAAVTARVALPPRSPRLDLPTGPWYSRWRLAGRTDGQSTTVLVTAPGEMWRVTLGTEAEAQDLPGSSADAVAMGRSHALVASGTALRAFEGATETARWSVPGRQLAVAEAGGTVHGLSTAGAAWRWEEGGAVQVGTLCAGAPTAAAWLAEGGWVAACAAHVDAAWELLPLGASASVLGGRRGAGAPAVAASLDGRFIATGADAEADAGVILWDARAGRPVAAIPGRPPVDLDFDAEAEHLLVVDDRGMAVRYDLAAVRQRFAVSGYAPPEEPR